MRLSLSHAAFLLLFIALSGLARADTIKLTTGGLIKNCRLLERDATHLHLRTLSGRMAVPNSIVGSVRKSKSIFDTYDEKLASLDAGAAKNANAVFELASWCRKAGGLRDESSTLLARVLEISPNHAAARRLLGYVRIGAEWKAVPALVLHFEPGEGASKAASLYRQLAIIVGEREDLELSKARKGKDGFLTCSLQCDVVTFTNRGASYFGLKLQGATSRATATLGFKAGWLGTLPLTLKLEGETPASVPNAAEQAITDAVVRHSVTIHSFLDRIAESRVTRLQAAHDQRARKAANVRESRN